MVHTILGGNEINKYFQSFHNNFHYPKIKLGILTKFAIFGSGWPINIP